MKIEHAAIWARDIDELKNFYARYFGATSNDGYTNHETGFSSYFLSFDSGARLEIMRLPSVPQSANDPYEQFTGFIHIAISVGSVETVDALTANLAQDGYQVLDGPRRTGDGYYESVILDPEGNRVEITV
ncbi:VOC family protein [Chloroflexota bacterium]